MYLAKVILIEKIVNLWKNISLRGRRCGTVLHMFGSALFHIYNCKSKIQKANRYELWEGKKSGLKRKKERERKGRGRHLIPDKAIQLAGRRKYLTCF